MAPASSGECVTGCTDQWYGGATLPMLHPSLKYEFECGTRTRETQTGISPYSQSSLCGRGPVMIFQLNITGLFDRENVGRNHDCSFELLWQDINVLIKKNCRIASALWAQHSFSHSCQPYASRSSEADHGGSDDPSPFICPQHLVFRTILKGARLHLFVHYHSKRDVWPPALLPSHPGFC